MRVKEPSVARRVFEICSKFRGRRGSRRCSMPLSRPGSTCRTVARAATAARAARGSSRARCGIRTAGRWVFRMGRWPTGSSCSVRRMRAAISSSRHSTGTRARQRCRAGSNGSSASHMMCCGLYLRLPAAESFDFKPGQYIDVLLPKGRRRSFSIASPPHDARPSSCTCAAPRAVSSRSRCSMSRCAAPLPDHRRAPRRISSTASPRTHAPPMLLLGGGTGICAAEEHPAACSREWPAPADDAVLGRAQERDLYAHAFLERGGAARRALALCPGSLRAFARVGRTGGPGARGGARGHRGTRALRDLCERATGHDRGGAPRLRGAGCTGVGVLFDSFDYADDSRARQPTRADTKS